MLDLECNRSIPMPFSSPRACVPTRVRHSANGTAFFKSFFFCVQDKQSRKMQIQSHWRSAYCTSNVYVFLAQSRQGISGAQFLDKIFLLNDSMPVIQYCGHDGRVLDRLFLIIPSFYCWSCSRLSHVGGRQGSQAQRGPGVRQTRVLGRRKSR